MINHDEALEMHHILFHGVLRRLRASLNPPSRDRDAIDNWIYSYLYACIMFSTAGNVYCKELCRITTPFFEIADTLNGV